MNAQYNITLKYKDTGTEFNLAIALNQLRKAGADSPVDLGYDPIEETTWHYSNPHTDGDDESLIGAYWTA